MACQNPKFQSQFELPQIFLMNKRTFVVVMPDLVLTVFAVILVILVVILPIISGIQISFTPKG